MAEQPDFAVAATAADFASYYRNLLREIQQLYVYASSISEKRRLYQLYLQYKDFLKEVDQEADLWMRTNLPSMFVQGSDDAAIRLRSLGINDFTIGFAQLHKEAIDAVIATMKREITGATDTLSNTLLSYTRRLQLSSEEQRNVLLEVSRSVAMGDTTPTLSSKIAERLAAKATGGFIKVGKRTLRVDNYAELLARTHLRVAYSRGTELRLKANGIHLVVISEHGTQCKICGPLEGKIFSLDGSDSRFPPLNATPNEGTPFHPNCLHVVLPFIEELAIEGEVADRTMDPADWPFKTKIAVQ